MNDPRYQQLREIAWRRRLNAIEEDELRAWLAAHPEAAAAWEDDSALNECLSRLNEAPVSSNFTARVLRAVERDAAIQARERQNRWSWLWRPILPRIALAALAFSTGLGAQRGMAIANRTRLAESVAAVSSVASQPSPDALLDFDLIRQLSASPPPDDKLLPVLTLLAASE